jgi:hypothetical protein
MKQILTLLSVILITLNSFSQEKKSYQISRCQTAPKIDGVLDDAIWNDVEIASGFVQFRPDVGIVDLEEKRTEVKMTYDDSAIYIAAYLYDNTEDIMTQFTQRDNFGQSDFFGMIFNPNNDAQNNTEFFVFSSGTQADAVESPNNGEDFGWNAVWESSVKIQPDGWIVEVKIPYRALRFAQQENPIWGIQFHRHFRKTRAQSTWNPIDVTKGSIGLYNGELKGLNNIKPPTRFNLYPYASYLVSDFENKTETDFAAGLDIKYGITENITLDATLIPDFSQAGFDDVELNLGPFEQQFAEQRQFFTEGVDLFNKGNLFYSRRVGDAPSSYPVSDANERVIDYPDKVQLLNAIKISGRTKNSLGIGFFNAITEKTDVDILNTDTNTTRSETVEPLTNYNIMVLDQQFNKNSSITLINTNVTRNNGFRDANVTAFLVDLINKSNTYGAIGQIKMSTFNDSDLETGFSSTVGFGKNSGNFRYSLLHFYADENYNPNDLGILFRNNYNNIGTELSYRSFKPTEKLNNYYIGFSGEYNRLKSPNKYTGLELNAEFRATNKKLHSFGTSFEVNPGKQNDYFEPRDNFNSFFTTKNYYQHNVWISSNYNTFFSLDSNLGYGTLLDSDRNYHNTYFSISPRFKFNSKFLLVLGLEHNNLKGDQGYVNGQSIDDRILFGQRNRKDIETSISGSYNFNPFNALTLSFRNYLSTVEYDYNLYVLQVNGNLEQSSIYNKTNSGFNPDANFNTWNLDLSYTWQFAPGSQLTALYRNQIFNFSNNAQDNYFTSTNTLFKQEARNTFSLRLVYFIDYNDLKNVFKSKTS